MMKCPRCGSDNTFKLGVRQENPEQDVLQCRSCRKVFDKVTDPIEVTYG